MWFLFPVCSCLFERNINMNYKLDMKQWSGTWNNGTWDNITYFNTQHNNTQLDLKQWPGTWNNGTRDSITNFNTQCMLFCPKFHRSMCQTIVSSQVYSSCLCFDSCLVSRFGCSPLYKINCTRVLFTISSNKWLL